MNLNIETPTRKLYDQTYYLNNKNKEKEALRGKLYREKNKSKIIERCKRYREKNKENIKSKAKAYYYEQISCVESKEKYLQKYQHYIKKRKRNDINFKLRQVLRSRIFDAIKRNSTISRSRLTAELLGCSIQECRHHIEKQWLPGMSWENHTHTGWHIDHIKPVNTFDLTDPEQQKQCFHYTNLRPLWAKDNKTRPHDGSDISIYDDSIFLIE